MRYGVFADIHSNLEALDAVLSFFRKEKISSYICAGDLVGYGPNPNECIEKIKSLKNVVVVGGNHDKAAVGMKDTSWFNDFATRAVLWTKRHLTSSNYGYLTRLPNTAEKSKFFIAHGSARDPLDEYLLSPIQFQESLVFFSAQVCFVGHTHVPNFFMQDQLQRIKIKSPMAKDVIRIEPDSKAVYNPGSVGQPRDGDPRASCAIYDADKLTIRLFRINYNIGAVQNKMRKVQLPLYLIERLSEGR